MKTEEFVEAALNYKSAKEAFIDDICSELDLSKSKIKNVEFVTDTESTSVRYFIWIELIGKNYIKSEKLSKMEGVTIVTPKWMKINCGEINL